MKSRRQVKKEQARASGKRAAAKRVENDLNAIKLQEIAAIIEARRSDRDRRSDSQLFHEIERIIRGEP
jgi:hypothetical protein